MKKTKVSIIGAGFVGSTAANLLAGKDICDIVLVDIIEGVPQGKALDMQESSSILGFDSKIIGTNDYKDTKDSDIVVITAGVARKPGMTRDDLIGINSKILFSASKEVAKYSPNAIIIVVSNPLDAMVYIAKKVSGFEKNKVMGMAGVLDSARFKTFISLKTGISSKNINAMVLGGHGDDMVPLSRLANIGGVPISELLSEEKIKKIEERTRNGGAEIVNYLKTGSAYFAPAASIVLMVEAIILDKKTLLSAAVWLEGEYGYENMFMGVPVVLGKDGVESIIELNLLESEKAALDKTAKNVKELTAIAEKMIKDLG
jgi:malate dehydrogenase